MLRNTPDRYGSVHKALHWAIALLIVGMLMMGFLMTELPNNSDKLKLYGLHKSIGICILLLAAIRLAWKLANVRPLLPARMSRLEKTAAHAGHFALYLMMFAMPLSGWMMSSAWGTPVSVFGLPPLPLVIEPDRALSDQLAVIHSTIGWALAITIGLHATAALLHHFYWRDNVLRRMLPFARPIQGD